MSSTFSNSSQYLAWTEVKLRKPKQKNFGLKLMDIGRIAQMAGLNPFPEGLWHYIKTGDFNFALVFHSSVCKKLKSPVFIK